MKKIFLVIALLTMSSILIANTVSAETLRSDSYTIHFGNFNITSGQKSGGGYTLTDTVGQTFAQQFDGTGYLVKSGFQYIYPFRELRFSISSLTIDLGELTTDSFSTGSHDLWISTDGAGGYSIKAYETHPLKLRSGPDTIPDTTCDSNDCDEEIAGVWTNATTNGFGFNVNGDDVVADFVNTNYFRQFADLSSGESMQTIMSSDSLVTNHSSTITYKVSVDALQTAGEYETTVVYTAIPSY